MGVALELKLNHHVAAAEGCVRDAHIILSKTQTVTRQATVKPAN